MTRRNGISCLVLSTVLVGTAPMARADGAEAFVGGLLGSAIGTAITNNVQRQQPRTIVEKHYVTPRAPKAQAAAPVPNYQREENRRVQTALNYFGYNAGYADGVIGGGTRAAISQYQASLGWSPTGVLMDNERYFLTSSYERALAGGSQATQVIAASGTRGLLLAYRQEQLGQPIVAAQPPAVVAPVPVVIQPPAAVVPAPTVPSVVAPIPVVLPPASMPVVEAASTSVPASPQTRAAAMPNFMANAAHPATPGALCNSVAAAASKNGGTIEFFDVAFSDVDPGVILDEQFCAARAASIAQAESLVSAIDGFTPAEMRTQCEAFAPTMAKFTSALAGRSPEEVNRDVRAFLDGTGMDPAQMNATARICLGIGYSTDNAQLALGSALVLTALGEEPYGELVGYQVLKGYGVPADCDCGLGWMSTAVDSLKAKATPLVADPSGDRLELLEYAVSAVGGGGDESAPTTAVVAPAAGQAAAAFGLPKAP